MLGCHENGFLRRSRYACPTNVGATLDRRAAQSLILYPNSLTTGVLLTHIPPGHTLCSGLRHSRRSSIGPCRGMWAIAGQVCERSGRPSRDRIYIRISGRDDGLTNVFELKSSQQYCPSLVLTLVALRRVEPRILYIEEKIKGVIRTHLIVPLFRPCLLGCHENGFLRRSRYACPTNVGATLDRRAAQSLILYPNSLTTGVLLTHIPPGHTLCSGLRHSRRSSIGPCRGMWAIAGQVCERSGRPSRDDVTEPVPT